MDFRLLVSPNVKEAGTDAWSTEAQVGKVHEKTSKYRVFFILRSSHSGFTQWGDSQASKEDALKAETLLPKLGMLKPRAGRSGDTSLQLG